jgi:hypothetical protein
MRIIKCRAVPIGDTQFIKGSLWYGSENRIFIVNEAMQFIECRNGTQCEFTGRLDSNGTEIYGKDLFPITTRGNGICQWFEKGGWLITWAGYSRTLYSYLDVRERRIIAGNVIQNPELIGQ